MRVSAADASMDERATEQFFPMPLRLESEMPLAQQRSALGRHLSRSRLKFAHEFNAAESSSASSSSPARAPLPTLSYTRGGHLHTGPAWVEWNKVPCVTP